MKKNIPNILSVLRMVLAPVFLVMYVQDEVIWRALSVAVFAVAAITDFFDGYLARYYGVESDFGVFIDPLADKFLTFAGFFCLPFLNEELFPWWAVGVIVGRDVCITILRMVANRKKKKMETRFSAKAKTTVQMVFLYAVLLAGVFIGSDVNFEFVIDGFFQSVILYYAMLFVTALTLYSGIEYVWVNRSLFKS
ncbi:MAG: CDP-diacylglycerol--glycerol-3-phosphate 3-phosphatidyltransferase [Bacteroidota bacterium]